MKLPSGIKSLAQQTFSGAKQVASTVKRHVLHGGNHSPFSTGHGLSAAPKRSGSQGGPELLSQATTHVQMTTRPTRSGPPRRLPPALPTKAVGTPDVTTSPLEPKKGVPGSRANNSDAYFLSLGYTKDRNGDWTRPHRSTASEEASESDAYYGSGSYRG